MSDRNPEQKPRFQMTRRDVLRTAGYIGAGAALSSLLGCSTKTSTPAPGSAPAAAPAVTGQAKPKLRVWLLKTYVDSANKAAEANIQEWATKNNAEVEVQYYTFDDMQTKYVASIEAKNLPDVGELDTIGPARYRAMGILTDVSGIVAEVEKASGKLSESAKRSPFLDGKYWGVPHYNMPAIMYYRKDLLEKAGVSKIPETFDEMRSAGKAIKEKTGIWGMGWPWNRTSDGYGPWVAVAASYGVMWADKDGKYKSINTPEARQMLEWMTAPYTIDKSAPPDALSWNGAGNNEAFMKGQVAITPNGPSITWAMQRDKNPLLANTVSARFPKGPKGAFGFLNMYSLGIFKTSKYPEQAASLIKHMMAPNVWSKYMSASGGQAVPIYDSFEGNAMWKEPDAAQWLAQTKQDVNVGYPGPITAAAAEVQASNVLTDMVTKVIVDKWSLEQSIKWGDERIKEIYATVKG